MLAPVKLLEMLSRQSPTVVTQPKAAFRGAVARSAVASSCQVPLSRRAATLHGLSSRMTESVFSGLARRFPLG
jgi:hypothetical protein